MRKRSLAMVLPAVAILAAPLAAQTPPTAQNIIPDGISFATEGTLQTLDPGAGTLTVAPKDQTAIPMTVAPGVSLAGIEQGDFASIHYTRTVTFTTGNPTAATTATVGQVALTRVTLPVAA
jgi:hypothetical protein